MLIRCGLVMVSWIGSQSWTHKMRDWTHSSHEPEYIVTTVNRSGLITIITWYFLFHPMNDRICEKNMVLKLKWFTYYTHYYIMSPHNAHRQETWSVWSVISDIHVTWVLWQVQSLGPRLLIQQFLQASNEGNVRAPHYWPFVRGGFPSQRASNVEF